MFYKWKIEITNTQSGEIRVIENQENLTNIAKWEKEINKKQWEIIKIEKIYTNGNQ